MGKATYDERAIGPRRITEEDWYGLARRDRAAIMDALAGVPVGMCVGKVQDHLHEARQWALLERFMEAMQRALDAEKVRDQISMSYQLPSVPDSQISWTGVGGIEPLHLHKLAPEAADDDEPDLHQPPVPGGDLGGDFPPDPA